MGVQTGRVFPIQLQGQMQTEVNSVVDDLNFASRAWQETDFFFSDLCITIDAYKIRSSNDLSDLKTKRNSVTALEKIFDLFY